MVVLATAATVIASQSLISGAFSLVSQAIRLGLFPRLDIEHTHHAHEGQVYIPAVNWVLLAGCVALVLDLRLERGAGGRLRSRRLRSDGHHLGRHDPDRPALLGLEPGADRARLGAADRAERRLLHREFAQASRGRLRADRRRRRRLRHDGDLALGTQGDLRRPQRQGDADHVRGRHVAPGEQDLPRAQRADHVAAPAAEQGRPRPVADPPDCRAHRHVAAEPDLRRGQPQEDPLHSRQPISGHRIRPRARKRAVLSASSCPSASSRSPMSKRRWKTSRGITKSTCRSTRTSGSSTSCRTTSCPRGETMSSSACGSACFSSLLRRRAPPIRITDSAMRCNSPSRSFQSGCGSARAGDLRRSQRWTADKRP